MTRGQAMLEALLAMPLLILAAATALQLALVAIAGLLTRHAANLAARAAAVTGGSTETARGVAARVCAPVDRAPEVERLEPAPAAFADFGDRFAFDSADARRIRVHPAARWTGRPALARATRSVPGPTRMRLDASRRMT